MRAFDIESGIAPVRDALFSDMWRGSVRPVLDAVAVEVSELDRRVLAVDPDPADLVRREHAVDHGGQRARGKSHQRGGNVLGLDVVHEPARHRADLGPVAEQMQQQIHLVDAVSHGGPAALGPPFPAPRNGVVARVAVPRGLAVRDQRASQLTGCQERAEVLGRRAEPLLEHESRVRPAFRLGRGDLVEFRQRQAWRLLAPRPSSTSQHCLCLLDVQPGRRADRNQIGFLFRQQGVQIVVRTHVAAQRAEVAEAGFVDIHRGHDLDVRGVRKVSGPMLSRDHAGADDRGP